MFKLVTEVCFKNSSGSIHAILLPLESTKSVYFFGTPGSLREGGRSVWLIKKARIDFKFLKHILGPIGFMPWKRALLCNKEINQHDHKLDPAELIRLKETIVSRWVGIVG